MVPHFLRRGYAISTLLGNSILDLPGDHLTMKVQLVRTVVVKQPSPSAYANLHQMDSQPPKHLFEVAMLPVVVSFHVACRKLWHLRLRLRLSMWECTWAACGRTSSWSSSLRWYALLTTSISNFQPASRSSHLYQQSERCCLQPEPI
jgi:hypothetical protein